jgi:hypothetical protein
VLADPRYQEIRNHLLTFLNERSHIRPSRITPPITENVTVPERSTPAGAAVSTR